jgi:predicted TIM-barrel fold metal-dependent hydrolase
MPTHDSEPEVKAGGENRPFVLVSRNGQLLPEVLEVLSVIAQNDLTLATGHVSPAEAFMIMREAKKRGVQRMIVTHPLLGLGGAMTVEQMQEAAKLGAYIEITAGTVSRQGPAQARAFDAIRKVGPSMCFVGSDSGLPGNNHTDALVLAARALRGAGFTEKELNMMFKDNPAKLVKLPVLP